MDRFIHSSWFYRPQIILYRMPPRSASPPTWAQQDLSQAHIFAVMLRDTYFELEWMIYGYILVCPPNNTLVLATLEDQGAKDPKC
jgi:hypothetical protein